MKCPTDDTVLVMSERSGIEIDYCPQCRGVWLDRGELDKILERAASTVEPAPAPPPQPRQAPAPEPQYRPAQRVQHRDDPRSFGYDDDRQYRGDRRRKKKEHWLMELFD